VWGEERECKCCASVGELERGRERGEQAKSEVKERDDDDTAASLFPHCKKAKLEGRVVFSRSPLTSLAQSRREERSFFSSSSTCDSCLSSLSRRRRPFLSIRPPRGTMRRRASSHCSARPPKAALRQAFTLLLTRRKVTSCGKSRSSSALSSC
jgi:hypothetical protein